jgi:hypothetical protein
LRLNGITDNEDVNEFLDREYIFKHNQRNRMEPANDFGAHRPPDGLNLNSIFSVLRSRVVNNDYTILLYGRRFQIVAGSRQA